jgi:hypothetical protein
MPLPLFGKVVGGLLQSDPATAVAFDAIQHLIDTRPLRQPAQLTSEVLLQRLSTLLSPALQGGVHILRNIPHEHVWHAYIMLSTSAVCNPRAASRALAGGLYRNLCLFPLGGVHPASASLFDFTLAGQPLGPGAVWVRLASVH